MRRRFAVFGSAAAMGLFVVAPPAGAVSARLPEDTPLSEIVFAGDQASWIAADSIGRRLIRSLSPAGAVSTPVPPIVCEDLRSLTASQTRIAVVRATQNPSCAGGANVIEVLTGAPGTPLTQLEAEPATGCATRMVDLDGDLLAEARGPCPDGDIILRDLGSGTVVDTLAVGGTPADVRIAGRFLAWQTGGTIVVYDRVARQEAYRLDLVALDPATVSRSDALRGRVFDLDADGVVVASPPRSSWMTQTVGWASPASPVWHPLPFGTPGGLFALAGARIAVQRERDNAVVDLDGRVESVFDNGYGDSVPAGIGFDGRRVAWWRHPTMHSESWPYTAPARASLAPVRGGAAPEVIVSSETVNATRALRPALSGDARAGDVLLTWTTFTPDVPRGRVVAEPIDAAGRPRSAARTLSEAEVPSAATLDHASAATSYDPRARRFLVVWPAARSGLWDRDVVARWVDRAARPRGPAVRVGATVPGEALGFLDAATLSGGGQALVAYSSAPPERYPRVDAEARVFVVRVSGAGRPLGRPRVVIRRFSAGTIDGALAANPRTGEYLLVYTEGSVVRARRLDPKGVPIGAGDILVSGPLTATASNPRVAVQPRSGRFVVTWQEGAGVQTRRFIARPLRRNGRPENARRPFAGEGTLEVAPDGAGTGWLYAWSRDVTADREIWAQAAAANGAASGEPFRISQSGPDAVVRQDPTGVAWDPVLLPLAGARRFLGAWSADPAPKAASQVVTRVLAG